MADAARAEALEAENERLRARIDELEDILGFRFLPPLEWQLTPNEARIFGVILTRPLATKAALMSALYRDEGRDPAEPKIIDVFVCKIRKKLKRFGIAIETRWAEGWFMTAEMKAACKEAWGI